MKTHDNSGRGQTKNMTILAATRIAFLAVRWETVNSGRDLLPLSPPRSPQFWSSNTTNLVATRNKKRKKGRKGNVYKLEFTPMFGQQYVSAELTWLLCKFWVQTKIQIYYNTNIWRTVATKIAMLFRVIDLTQFCQFCASLVCVICDIFYILLILKTAELITATLPK